MHTPHVPFFYATNTFYAILYFHLFIIIKGKKRGFLIERKICRH